jgi:hypothetical protein
MTKFVVEVTLLQRCFVEAGSKEEAEENISGKSLRGIDFISVSGEDPTIISIRAEEFKPAQFEG